ncbi:MAG: hypothetical protein GYA40_04520 [Chloroflexi bacterium]|nr:hypothetical protein [Chloroflexota bacterium]
MEDNPIRNEILERALRLGCIEEVSGVSDIQAVRYIQEKEGHTPCYAREVPIIEISYPPGSCGVYECSWRNSCDEYRNPKPLGLAFFNWQHGKDTILRTDIIKRADQHNLVRDVLNLSDIEAIRLIQKKEGFTSCYARENPLRPSVENPKCCSEWSCHWKPPCDSYRNEALVPIDKELSEEKHAAIKIFQERIAEYASKLTTPTSKTVGLQIRSFGKIFSASKKMVLASPQTIVRESTEDPSTLKRYLFADNTSILHSDSGGYTFEYTFDVLFSSDILRLNQWLSETRPFLESGNLAYYPIIKSFSETKNVGRGGAYSQGAIPSFWTLSPSFKPETFNAPHLGVPDGDIMLTHSEFAPILNLELPVLENLDFKTLFKLMSDYPEEMCSFRDFLQVKMDEMRKVAIGSEEFSRDCNRIEREIREHLRKLDSDYKKGKLKSAFVLTGCAVAGWTLAIYCFLQGNGNVLTVLGPGGLAYTASAAYSDYLIKRLELKDDPVYFLWLLGKSKRKT